MRIRTIQIVSLGLFFEITMLISMGCGAPETPSNEQEAEQNASVQSAPRAKPPGMVYVPGGQTKIGSERGRPIERPVFSAAVDAFWMDTHPVTVEQFRQFVKATDYTTDAERFGDAGIFDLDMRQWRLVKGAQWRTPRGPDGPSAPDNHPVTQVSWHDATAYCEWAGKRLPTEIEWEHAARSAQNNRNPYAWGSALVDAGQYQANTWQGHFPAQNTGADGYLYTSPVGAFGTTSLGLTDMGGNVWEWTDSWFRPYPLRGAPTASRTTERVQRGGSFLCHRSYCHGYRVSARSHSTPETALFHVGFRCIKDVASDS